MSTKHNSLHATGSFALYRASKMFLRFIFLAQGQAVSQVPLTP